MKELSSDSLVSVRSLTKRYGKKTALDHLDLDIPAGRIIGLLGPNGSGKSTLIKLLCGLLVPSDGQICIAGNAPGILTKSCVSYLPERTYLPDTVRIRELVSFFSDFYADFDRQKALSMLDTLRLSPDSPLKDALQRLPREGAAYHGHEPPRKALYFRRADRRGRSRRTGFHFKRRSFRIIRKTHPCFFPRT